MAVPIQSLQPLRYKTRVSITDYRAPLSSPVTLLVMLLKSVGFDWYGAEKKMPNGDAGTVSFLDTTVAYADGTQARKITWNFLGDDKREIGGAMVSLDQIAHYLRMAQRPPASVIDPAAAEVLKAIREQDIWRGELPFNERGRRLAECALNAPNPEAREILSAMVVLYRGFCWKLSARPDGGPHPDYGYPLERHIRYQKGKRKGDVRMSISKDERMAELETFKLI